jgi:caa(3)-type oxidase subunit IV
VWGILVILTVMTVGAAKIDLGGANIVVALLIAVVKSSFVALYFMHLRYDRPFHSVILVCALSFVMLFISFTLIDTREYRPEMIADYAPAIAEARATAAGTPGAEAGAGGAVAGTPATGEDVAAAPAASADPERGKELYERTCTACHGPQAEGIRSLNSPALHLQEDWYIVAQLEKFRSGLRGADVKDIAGRQMAAMAKALPDDQSMYDLAAYITGLDGPPPTPEVEGDPVRGEEHYRKICVACHGPDGRGMPTLKSPALVGQNDWYVVAQLKKYRAGLRGTDPKDITGMQMQPMAMTLPDESAIRDVAAYIAGLPIE